MRVFQVFRDPNPNVVLLGSTSPYPRRSWSHVGLIVSLFLAIWSVKLAVIARYGTDLPYWDQWAKEGELLYAPWFERHELWHNLFVPHNEHRIAPTLAMNWLLLRLGGNQWDARVQCVASAALHAALMAALAAWVLRKLDRGRLWEGAVPSAPQTGRAAGPPSRKADNVGAIGLCLLLVLVAAPPIAWENVLGGFQSVFYFLAIFSLLAIAGLLGSPAWSWRWFGGIVAAMLACVSMGSGMLVAAPIAVMAARRLMAQRGGRVGATNPRSDALATLGAAVVIGAVGWWLRPQAPWHAALHAHSILEYTHYAARCLAWPLYDRPWLAAVLWAPWVIFATRSLTKSSITAGPATTDHRGAEFSPRAQESGAEFILAGGLWVLAQVAAVCFARAGGSELPAPRYGDIFALGVVFNAMALGSLLGPASGGSPALRQNRGDGLPQAKRMTWRMIPALWLAVSVVAIAAATRDVFHEALPRKKADAIAYEHNVQAFVLTDDYPALEKAAPLIPFPITDWLARMLRNPTLRHLLPQSVREPMHVPGLNNASPALDVARAAAPLPPLDHRATRTLTTPGEWRSGPLPAMPGWWKIETGGDIGKAGAVLELRAVADDHILATIAPTKPAGAGWRAAYVPAPQEPARLYAALKPPAHVLGFSEPIEMSSLSFWTWRLVEHAGWLAAAAVAGLLGFGVAALRSTRPQPASSTGIPPLNAATDHSAR